MLRNLYLQTTQLHVNMIANLHTNLLELTSYGYVSWFALDDWFAKGRHKIVKLIFDMG